MGSMLDLEKKVAELEGKLTHLHIRSELTLYVISAMIGAGVVKKDGVLELIKDADLSAFNSPDIANVEKNIVSNLLGKVTVTR
ncbi:hypothetical protein [Serratia marcescens]|uniref:hypothetical protein n=1 Tax=Serratia marcescens TaxID=615 RepID=UPI0027E46EDC|nr:hypothetical protein [Serratia marcescens]